MRRRDKEIRDRREIDRIIRAADVCRLGLVDGGRAYIVPMSFGYDPDGTGTLFFHSAREGRKVELFEGTGAVAFEIDRSFGTSYRHRKDACSWSIHYESVMGAGNLKILAVPAEKIAGLDTIMAHYAGNGVLNEAFTYSPAVLEKTVVFTLEITEMTGKRSREAEE